MVSQGFSIGKTLLGSSIFLQITGLLNVVRLIPIRVSKKHKFSTSSHIPSPLICRSSYEAEKADVAFLSSAPQRIPPLETNHEVEGDKNI